jgi:hypothetical protein
MVERPPGDKYFSLLRTFVNYGRKKFYNIPPRSCSRQGRSQKPTVHRVRQGQHQHPQLLLLQHLVCRPAGQQPGLFRRLPSTSGSLRRTFPAVEQFRWRPETTNFKFERFLEWHLWAEVCPDSRESSPRKSKFWFPRYRTSVSFLTIDI